MDYYLKYNKYKIKYINLKCNNTFKELDNISIKLHDHYLFLKKLTEQSGGGDGESIIVNKTKINKYKKYILSAKQKINRYKNMIKEYQRSHIYNNTYYAQTIQRLMVRKNELESIHNNLENIDLVNNNNIEKITMLENAIIQLNKLIGFKTNIDLNINNLDKNDKIIINKDISVNNKSILSD